MKFKTFAKALAFTFSILMFMPSISRAAIIRFPDDHRPAQELRTCRIDPQTGQRLNEADAACLRKALEQLKTDIQDTEEYVIQRMENSTVVFPDLKPIWLEMAHISATNAISRANKCQADPISAYSAYESKMLCVFENLNEGIKSLIETKDRFDRL